ncbi:GTP-binding protein YPTC4 [Tritrichomonas foetus]|uniref:GTP-binding protein YPTC4 n=1 Tax=Tritrichomonas foetus TaxID=1144522 RepID=A0A1J4JGH8_9EUKA|nr:GTP-binding protein YPTC4 [Tritrichomonas foetus]|eukprot:OHS98250.1 GTP-binding protein YPTC4 [Tritrichomonas foetus]
MTTPAFNFKFIIVGNSAVGKSCLLLRFDEDRFQPIHDVTVGVTFSIKMLQMDGKDVKVQIWDTAGQEIFRSITRSYYRDSNCAIIVYDITDRTSFDKVGDWIRDVRNLAPPECQLVLVGNKLDLASSRAISTSEAQDFADQHNLIFFEASAATGENVQKLFNECVSAVFNKAKNNGPSTPKQTVVVTDSEKPKQNCPC